MNPAVLRLALGTALLVAAFSMYGPVLAVLLQQRGYGPAVVGAFAMIGFACIALLIPVLPNLLARLGEIRAYRIGMLMQLLATVGYATSGQLWIWCASAVLGGLGSAAVWNATEALIARHSPPLKRGQITGLYQTMLGAAMTLGPFVPTVLEISAGQTLALAVAVQGVGVLLVLWLRELDTPAKAPPSADTHANADADSSTDVHALAAHGAPAIHQNTLHQATLTTWRALQRVPALAGIAFVGGVFETGLSSLSAANGAAAGLSLGGAASIVGVLGFGSFLLQLPAGLIADRVAPSKVFGAAGALLLASSILFAWAGDALWLLWACAFVWGGVGGSLYTLTMIRVAHQFKGRDTAAGTATMITGYTLGGALGPLMGGAMLQGFSLPGLAGWLSLLSVGVIGLSGALSTRRAGRVS